ncbi:hypothetical protein GCM10009554_75770 [Kribbella koreensis]|uniref:Uncharacterized protein n=1 Tax=Kribbella koreensis TaxID=57909 RepID=A0ABP4C4Z5_9ACTN
MEKAEFGFPGPLRDQLVGAVLAGTKTSTTGLVADADLRHVIDDPAFTVDDSTEAIRWRFRLVTDLRPA